MLHNDNAPCVDFEKLNDGNVRCSLTIFVTGEKEYGNWDIVPRFQLVDTCHQALIITLNAIWPNWYDYHQKMASYKAAEAEEAEADAEAELVRQAEAQ